MENTIGKKIDSLYKQVDQQSKLLVSIHKVSELQTKMLLEESERTKAWTVMMISARIHVWLVDSSLRDALVEDRSIIKRWLVGFPGAWIDFDAGELQSTDYDSYLELDRRGNCNEKECREKQPF